MEIKIYSTVFNKKYVWVGRKPTPPLGNYSEETVYLTFSLCSFSWDSICVQKNMNPFSTLCFTNFITGGTNCRSQVFSGGHPSIVPDHPFLLLFLFFFLGTSYIFQNIWCKGLLYYELKVKNVKISNYIFPQWKCMNSTL